MSLLVFAPYAGVFFGVFCVWLYLRRSIAPELPRNKRQAARIANGDCPEDGCGGVTYLVAGERFSTLWRCIDCQQTWILAALPRE